MAAFIIAMSSRSLSLEKRSAKAFTDVRLDRSRSHISAVLQPVAFWISGNLWSAPSVI